ncbi:unnamed protein product, partial [Durusdinium trenchii]
MSQDQRQEILKHAPLLRNPLYALHAAADDLESWVNGRLLPEPLLDVSVLAKPSGVSVAIQTYRKKSKDKLVLDMAAKCWGQGIEWNEALKIAQNAQKRIAER